jgi:hypothetical protein
MIDDSDLHKESSISNENKEEAKVMMVIGIFCLGMAIFLLYLYLVNFESFRDLTILSVAGCMSILGVMVLYFSTRELHGKDMLKRDKIISSFGFILAFTIMFTSLSLKSIYGHMGYAICFLGTFLIILGLGGLCLVIARIVTYALEPLEGDE